MSKPLPPFTCTYNASTPELLHALGCTIAISTYQADKLIFISAPTSSKLMQLPRNFRNAMGVAVKGDRLAVATRDEVVVLANSTSMAPNYPKKPNTYDALYLPRATYHTGPLDIHDMEWVDGRLIVVNTLFSCLSVVSEDYSFSPLWKPHFISSYEPTDRCHLNSMATENGAPKYVSALGHTDSAEGWRAHKASGGVIIDVESNEIIARNLPMPHSLRIYDQVLYALFSATGELAKIDTQSGSFEIIKKLDGFVRGMDRYGDYLFIGLSKLRENNTTFSDLSISKKSNFSGVVIIHMPTASIVGHIKYENSVEEIYDVKILPGCRRPGILNTEGEDLKTAITSPIGDFWALKKEQ